VADFNIKAHDLLPSIKAVLTNPDKTPVDLTTAIGLKFIMRPEAGGSVVKVSLPAVMETPKTSGAVRYDWAGSDTDTPGKYLGEWQVMWPGNRPQTFPTDKYHTIEVLADLDNA
jgi:hypothetical protein